MGIDIRTFLEKKKEEFDIKEDEELIELINDSLEDEDKKLTKANLNKWIYRKRIPDRWSIIIENISQLKANTTSINDSTVTIIYQKPDSKEKKSFVVDKFITETLFGIQGSSLEIYIMKDDTMEERIKKGESVLIVKDEEEKNGVEVAFFIKDKPDEIYIRTYYKDLLGKYIKLSCINKKYDEIKLEGSEMNKIEIIGVVKTGGLSPLLENFK